MRVPAFVQPDLSIGRSFDAKDSSPGIDLFAWDVSTTTEAANQFSFQYKVISKSEDARDLLDISGELSLKLKADLVKVSGSGQYLTDSKGKEGTTEILAVLKCTTVRRLLVFFKTFITSIYQQVKVTHNSRNRKLYFLIGKSGAG